MSDVLLRVEGIALWGYHGCERCEAEEGSPFRLGIEVAYPEPEAPLADTFDGRPDYAVLAERAVAVFTEERRRLVEPLAALIAETLLGEFPVVTRATVRIRKLAPVIPLRLDYSEVVVTRTRDANSR